MKQLLFLLLFPCLAMAQYTGNGNQKITLGEQTTADGLVFRGVASIDTVTATSKITRANKQDTSAFLLLDTVTNLLWHYKTASNGWIQAGGGVSVSSFSAGSTGLTPSTATTGAVTLGGTLAVANGGTNRTTMPAGYILHGDGTSVDTAIGLFWNRNARKLGVGTNTPSGTLDVQGIITNNAGGVQFPREFRNDFTPTFERADLFFFSNFTSDNGFRWGTIASSGGTTFQGTKATDSGVKTNINFNPDGGNVGIGTTSPTEKLHVDGNGLFTGNVTATRFNPTASTVTGTGMFLPAANTLGFTTGGVEKLRITETSIGFKVTPSSTSTDLATFQIGNATFSGAMSSNVAYVGTNYYYDQNAGVNKRIGAGYTTRFQTDNGYYYFLSGGDGAANSTVSFTQHMTLSDLGELWLGYTADQGAYRLQINGTPQATGALVVTSDEKFKENITPLNKGLEIVNKLKPVTFNFITDTKNNFSVNEEVGFIAQDVDRALSTETFAKSIVNSADDSEPTSTMGLATQNLIPILVKAIQEQNLLIKALEQRILILENK